MSKALLKTKLPREANPCDYLPWPLFFNKKTTKKMYGVELEVSTQYTPAQIYDLQETPFMICKHDGSISGKYDEHLELVTVPGSYTGLKVAFRKFFQKADITKFDTSKQTSNGIHVHINKEFMDQEHIERLNWFIQNPMNRVFIEAISERKTQDIQRWATLINWSTVKQSGITITQSNELKVAYDHAKNMRGAVHVSSKTGKTVEIRLFKGIVSYSSIMKALDFVDSVVVYTQEVTSKQKLVFEDYLLWLNSTPNSNYKVLKAFLEKTDIYKKYKTYIFQYELHSPGNNKSHLEFIELMSKNNIQQETDSKGLPKFYMINSDGTKEYISKDNELLNMIHKKDNAFLAELDDEFLKEPSKGPK